MNTIVKLIKHSLRSECRIQDHQMNSRVLSVYTDLVGIYGVSAENLCFFYFLKRRKIDNLYTQIIQRVNRLTMT